MNIESQKPSRRWLAESLLCYWCLESRREIACAQCDEVFIDTVSFLEFGADSLSAKRHVKFLGEKSNIYMGVLRAAVTILAAPALSSRFPQHLD